LIRAAATQAKAKKIITINCPLFEPLLATAEGEDKAMSLLREVIEQKFASAVLVLNRPEVLLKHSKFHTVLLALVDEISRQNTHSTGSNRALVAVQNLDDN
jgi:hypothetical protein